MSLTSSSRAECNGTIVGAATTQDPACDTITDLEDCANRFSSLGTGEFAQCETFGSNCVAWTSCVPPAFNPLPAACGTLVKMTFSSTSTPFYKIIDWDKSADNKGVTFDAGQACVNEMFKANGGVWLMEVSTDDGTTWHEWSVYKSIKDRTGTSFDPHGYIKYWRNAHNKMFQDFMLYSDINDAITGASPWQACNYNDAAAGFARDCCCRRSNAAFEPNRGGSGWGFFAPSGHRSHIRWGKIRFSMPADKLE